MDRLINDAANAAYDRVLRKAKRLQWIFLAAGLFLVLVFHFGLRDWDHGMFIAGTKFGGGFNNGLKVDPSTLAKLLPFERIVGWIALFWIPGLMIAFFIEVCVMLGDWLISLNRKERLPSDTLPIEGAAERALSQLILRESLSSSGIRFVRATISRNNTVQCSMRSRRTGFLLGFALLVLLFIRYN